MADQHVIELDGVRLTRLPVGRAEGLVWMSFVGRGEALEYGGRDPIDWRLSHHVTITWPDETPAEIMSSGSGGGDGLSLYDMAISDRGGSSLVLGYLDDGREVGKEIVTIPD